MPGFMKKTMVYLGLADDDYDDDDEAYESWNTGGASGAGRVATRVEEEPEPAPTAPTASIRTLSRDEAAATVPVPAPARPPVVRPMPVDASSRVHVTAPTEFTDGKSIADRLVGGQPVIVNLQLADRDLMRRIIDFCSGVAYAIGGKMERVADKVFLVTPQNVKVSAEERQRLQENGLVRA